MRTQKTKAVNTMNETRQELYSLLGDLPDRHRPISGRVVERWTTPAYHLEKLVLDLNGIQPVPAYFVRPPGAAGPLPVIVYNHAHGSQYTLGKDELVLGRSCLHTPPYAEALAGLGYALLCIDHWAFGQRNDRRESELFKQMLWQGQVLWGMMLYDSLRAVDYLLTRDDVDPNRLGTLGMSMGSTMAWWLAALESRIKVCVDICCLTDYEALIDARGLDGHGVYYYVPRLLKHFSTSQINALIAPRPHLGLAGDLDPLTPPAGLDRIDADMKAAYGAMGAADAWRLCRFPVGHQETAEMRTEILNFLRVWL